MTCHYVVVLSQLFSLPWLFYENKKRLVKSPQLVVKSKGTISVKVIQSHTVTQQPSMKTELESLLLCLNPGGLRFSTGLWFSSDPKWTTLIPATKCQRAERVRVTETGEWLGKSGIDNHWLKWSKEERRGSVSELCVWMSMNEVFRMRLMWTGSESVEVWFFWEGAACLFDDDTAGVVCSLHTPFYRFVLDKLWKKTWHAKKKSFFIYTNLKIKHKTLMNQLRRQDEPYLQQMHHRHHLCQQCPWGLLLGQGKSWPCPLKRQVYNITNLEHVETKKRNPVMLKTSPVAMTVSSLPWVNTTILGLFVFSLVRAWAFFAISFTSLVCGQNTH